ncbi:MAG TPA: ParB/RepB/Spo0J family partition protein [Xanthobacteraceae bacterium]|jgi:ParB family chromosome partitioning protein
MAAEERSRLGRGLAALIGDVGEDTKTVERGRNQRRVPIAFLKANPRNPRRNFADAELDELAASIRERGVIQPIVVRPVRGAADAFEIIAGERRWRAAQRAGLHEVPVIAVEASDDEALQLAIIENVQRTDLNPIEEAAGYQTLADNFGHTHDDIAKIVGKSRVHITNSLRLLKLSEKIQNYILSGLLSAGHGRLLIGMRDAEGYADSFVKLGLSVRSAEQFVRNLERANDKIEEFRKLGPRPGKSADVKALEKRLSDALGLNVRIDSLGETGTMHIVYGNLDQLDLLIRRLETER